MTKIIYFKNCQKIEKEIKEIPRQQYILPKSEKTSKYFDEIWNQAIELQQQNQQILNQKLQQKSSTSKSQQFELLSQKYQPQHYYDLIGYELTNKSIVSWFNQWRLKKDKSKENNDQLLKPALFWGLPGTGKSTMAKVLAKIYDYQLFVINASCERNGKKLLKKVLDICNTQVLTKNWSQNKKNNNKILLVLEEVDGVINSEKNSAIKYLLENIIDQNTKKMKINHPVIFICNNIYIKGLKTLRESAQIFLFEREREKLIERIIEVIQNEGKYLERFIIEEIVDNFNNDIRSILNYLQILLLKNNFESQQIRKDLKKHKDFDQNYFGALNKIFFSNQKQELDFYFYDETYLDGIYENYLDLDAMQDFDNLDCVIESLQNSDITLKHINGPSQNYTLYKQAYITIPIIQSLYSQKRKFKIEFINDQINYKHKKIQQQQIFQQLFQNLNIFNNRQLYLDIFCKMLDVEYNSLSMNDKQTKNFVTVLMLLIKLGVQIKENQNYKEKEDIENLQDDDNKQNYINKQQSQYILEPNIFQFLDYSSKGNQILLKRQTLATLKSKWDKVKQLMEINPQIRPGYIQFDQTKKSKVFSFYKNQPEEEQKKFYLHYKYNANDVSGVYYQLTFDFFS